jgi:antitoxin CptB
MDLLLGSFADAHIYAFSDSEVDQYEAIMEASDPDLYNWITGLEPVPAEHNSSVMQKLSAHSFARKQTA